MQIVYKNENERSTSRRTDSIDIIICVGRIDRYLEEKHAKGFRNRSVGI